MIKKLKNFVNNHGEQITSATPAVSSAFGIKQGTVGQIGSAIGSLIPGPVGTVVQVASQFAGTGDHRTVNEQTGEIEGDNGTGIIGGIQKLFGWGRSTNSLMNKQSRIKTSLADQQLTQDLNYNFYSDPNNSMNGNLYASFAKGGVTPDYTMIKVSPGEVNYNPETGQYFEYPGDGGKPNKTDSIETIAKNKNWIFSNSDEMKMKNGKTSATNAKEILDSKMPEKLKKIQIKKIFNWQEAKKQSLENNKFKNGGKIDSSVLDKAMEQYGFKTPVLKNTEITNWKNGVRKNTTSAKKFDWGNLFNTLGDYAPMIANEFADYSYETDPKFSYTPTYINTGVNVSPLLNQANEEYVLARYNSSNLSGAGIPMSMRAATNRRKAISDAYKWQQDTQNKLIAQNVGIKNEWAMRDAAASQTVFTNTQQNKAAARLMKDQARKDALEYQTGRRNDRWKLSMMEPLMQYAVDDKIWKKFKIA